MALEQKSLGRVLIQESNWIIDLNVETNQDPIQFVSFGPVKNDFSVFILDSAISNTTCIHRTMDNQSFSIGSLQNKADKSLKSAKNCHYRRKYRSENFWNNGFRHFYGLWSMFLMIFLSYEVFCSNLKILKIKKPGWYP